MRHVLQSLQLSGFKSFADRTTLDFHYPLIALVGPNGCGKSNVVDAIRWVLGETSVRSMRGLRMEDVIFMGSESRQATNVAEATIRLNNESGIIPVDFTEIEIRRRLFRSGESEFLLNGTPILLRELRALLHDTGMGLLSYAVLQQGKIDQILSNKPEERRAYFEEAAGITGHKVRWKETERKLQKTKEHLSVIDGRVEHLARQKASLQEQADKAMEHRSLGAKIFDLEVQLELHELSGVEGELERLSELQRELVEERNEVEDAIEARRKDCDDTRSRIAALETMLKEIDDELASQAIMEARSEEKSKLLRVQLEDLRGRLKYLEERLEELRAREVELDQLVHDQQQFLREEENEEKELLAQQARLESTLENKRAAGGLLEEREAACLKEITSARERQKKIQYELTSLTEALVALIDTHMRSRDASERYQAEQEVDRQMHALHDIFDSFGDENNPVSVKELRAHFLLLEQALTKSRRFFPELLEQLGAPEGLLAQKRVLEEDLYAAQKHEDALRAERLDIAGQRDTLRAEVQRVNEKIREARIAAVRCSERSGKYQENAQSADAQRGDLVRRREVLRAELQSCEQKIRHTEASFTENGDAKESRPAKELFERRKKVSKEHAKMRMRLEGSERKQERLSSRMQSCERRIHEASMKRVQFDTKIHAIKDRFMKRHATRLDGYSYEAKDHQTVLHDWKDLNARVAELGSINFLAAEQFEELGAEYREMETHQRDLSESLHELELLMQDAATEAKRTFTAHMQQIKKEFAQVFRTVFRGGKATLELEDEQNILESGITIAVQPPGKTLENISQLSGGERTLSAIALMLATFLVRPAPFCILDEVDATLDAENTQRFAQQLAEYAGRTQFIVVTHNILTTAAMDGVIGITMQESGVSTVTSVSFKEHDRVLSS